jgi:hypothetical protein
MLYGYVRSTEDVKKLRRIKVEIPGRTSGIDVSMLPYYMPNCGPKDVHDLPEIGELVKVFLIEDDVYTGYWERLPNPFKLDLNDDDYQSAKVLLYRDLAENGDEGKIELLYKKSVGFTMSLLDTVITIRRDKSVYVKNASTGKVVHISEHGISLGNENTSDQHGVLGESNKEALENLNDTCKKISDIVNKYTNNLSKVAKANPYTSAFAPVFTAFATEIQNTINNMHDSNANQFPDTLSHLVTLNRD